jgi:hypothetical protein
MQSLVLSPPLLGFIVGTRAALAFGVGLLVADRIPESRRKAIAMTLIGVGAATTVPAVRSILRNRRHEQEHGSSLYTDIGRDVRTVADM